MRSAKYKGLFFLALLGSNLFICQAFAANETGDDPFLKPWDDMKARLVALESQQQATLKKKDEILDALDDLRIQMRHTPGVGKAT